MPEQPRFHHPLYRAFHLGPAGGIIRADVIEAADDEDAILRIHAMAGDHVCELWDRARFVAKVTPCAGRPIVSRDAIAARPEH